MRNKLGSVVPSPLASKRCLKVNCTKPEISGVREFFFLSFSSSLSLSSGFFAAGVDCLTATCSICGTPAATGSPCANKACVEHMSSAAIQLVSRLVDMMSPLIRRFAEASQRQLREQYCLSSPSHLRKSVIHCGVP